MKQIGFKNFRKFENFPTMDLGDITILVGSNNTGKSTLVKAMMLVADNLKEMRTANDSNYLRPTFRFDASDFHDSHIGTYKRALNYNFTENHICFNTEIQNFKFIIDMKGNPDDEKQVAAFISEISIEDKLTGTLFCFDFEKKLMSAIFDSESSNMYYKQNLKRRLNLINSKIKKERKLEKIAELNSEKDRIEALIRDQGNAIKESGRVETRIYQPNERNFTFLLFDYINSFYTKYSSDESDIDISEQNDSLARENTETEIENRLFMQDKLAMVRAIAYRLLSVFTNIEIEYVHAHSATQTALYNYNDKNDYMAATIHDYLRSGIEPGMPEHTFVIDWMKEFEVGGYFNVEEFIGGEAYAINITNFDGQQVRLSDKGMGSNQIMILLLRLATILKEYKEERIKPIIIIEEPEQNLHPIIQSKLADLFNQFTAKGSIGENFKFIVETHSEYLVRRSEVLVAEQQYKDKQEVEENNPFKVYFFEDNINQPYYEMKYSETGRFEKKFGAGFYDAASTTALELSKLEKRRHIQ